MTYFEGFIVPVPEANRDAYRKHATDFAPLFQEVGVRRMVESVGQRRSRRQGHRLPQGGRCQARREGRLLLVRISSKQARDAANEKFMSDPRMEEMGADMPFDGKRMIMGGFDAIVEEGSAGGGYTDGFVVPVPEGKRDAYRELAAKMAKVFREHGATRVVEAFGDDVTQGKVTDFYRAVKAEDGEDVVFSLHRMARQGDPRRGVEEDHGRREPEARGRDAVRRQAHVLGRLRQDRRHRRAAAQRTGTPVTA